MLIRNNFFNDFFGDMFDDPFFNRGYAPQTQLMKTDIRETDGSYELDVDLPGFKKDEIQVQLKDGYLVLSAAKGLDKDEKDKEGNYIRRERYSGSYSRSYYVGDVDRESIKAKLDNGVLSIIVPKAKAEEQKKAIAIE